MMPLPPSTGTPENLQETLNKTLEEKQRVEQKYAEDCQRIEQKLEEQKRAISTYIALLQSMENTVQQRPPDTGQQPRPVEYPYLQPATPQVPPMTLEEMRRVFRDSISKPTDSFNISLGGIWKFVCSYLIPFAIMLAAAIWLLSLFSEKPKASGFIQLPSLMATAVACSLTDRIQERIQERREVRELIALEQAYRPEPTPTPRVEMPSDPPEEPLLMVAEELENSEQVIPKKKTGPIRRVLLRLFR